MFLIWNLLFKANRHYIPIIIFLLHFLWYNYTVAIYFLGYTCLGILSWTSFPSKCLRLFLSSLLCLSLTLDNRPQDMLFLYLRCLRLRDAYRRSEFWFFNIFLIIGCFDNASTTTAINFRWHVFFGCSFVFLLSFLLFFFFCLFLVANFFSQLDLLWGFFCWKWVIFEFHGLMHCFNLNFRDLLGFNRINRLGAILRFFFGGQSIL